MRISVSLTLAIVLASALSGQESERTVHIGFAGKGWTSDSQPVKINIPYSALADFEGTRDSGDLLLDCGSAGILAYTCAQDRCRIPACSTSGKDVIVHVIRQPEIPTTSAHSAFGMLASLLRRDPNPVSVLGVRGVGDPNDAVLLKDVDNVHWGPALKGVSEGEYCLRVGPLPNNNSEANDTVNLSWDRSNDPEGLARAPHIVPGLYQIEKGTPTERAHCDISSEATPAWVLIAAEPRFSRIAKAWADYALELKELNRSGTSPALQSTIRHAALAYLSDSR